MKSDIKKIRKVLQQAHDLIKRGWCRHELAKNSEGEGVTWRSQDACSFCAHGAILRAAGNAPILREDVRDIFLQSNNLSLIGNWNDKQRSKRPVLAAFKKAIALCK